MDSVLDLYKTKLKEALTLVTDLTIDRRIEAVSYWNELAEQLQDIIQKSGLATTTIDNGLGTNINDVNDINHQQQLDILTSTLSSSIGQTFDRIVQQNSETSIYSQNPIECRSTTIMDPLQQHERNQDQQLIQMSHLMMAVPNDNNTPLHHEMNSITTSRQMTQEHATSFMIPNLEQTHHMNHQHNQHHNSVDNILGKNALNERFTTQPRIEQNCSNDNKQTQCQSSLSQLLSANSSIHQDSISVNNVSPSNYIISSNVSRTNTTVPTSSMSPIKCSDITNITTLQIGDPFAEIKPFNMINQVPLDNNRNNNRNICSSNVDFINEHACQVCGKSGFSTKGNLKRHLRAHSGEKPFKCEYCESCFTEKKSLKIHVRRHTGEKPYKCQICGKPFSQTGVLQSHMALHYNERKFDCNKCGKAFRQRSQLKLHLMRHDGVKRLECSTCRAKFLTKGDLERHCRIHTGERPYLCHLCGKTFTRQQSLNEHLNRHTGRKPYDCKYCDKSFSEMSACYKHAKTHKKTDSKDQSEQTQRIN